MITCNRDSFRIFGKTRSSISLVLLLESALPILLSKPIANDTSSTFTFVFSHKLAISFIYDIFVAKKAFDAYLIISAPLLFVEKKTAPFLIKGSYKTSIFFSTFLLSDPITILSGNLKSLIASPSRKNSGLEITSKIFSFNFF